MSPPVIQHLRDMNDSLCLLGDTQCQVVIFGPAEFRAQPSQLLHQRLAVAFDMAPVHVGAQEVGTPTWLKPWLRTPTTRLYTILIPVTHLASPLASTSFP